MCMIIIITLYVNFISVLYSILIQLDQQANCNNTNNIIQHNTNIYLYRCIMYISINLCIINYLKSIYEQL
jgi:hypothetical protein